MIVALRAFFSISSLTERFCTIIFNRLAPSNRGDGNGVNKQQIQQITKKTHTFLAIWRAPLLLIYTTSSFTTAMTAIKPISMASVK
jgi:hypothetical protein